eukprot:COSAG05_NODE_1470_length_4792_cov_101.589815_5_plen_75_part_00
MTVKLLRLTQEDIESWVEEPELFLETLEAQSWEHDVKPCSEVLLSTLYERRPSIAAPIVVELVSKVRIFRKSDT